LKGGLLLDGVGRELQDRPQKEIEEGRLTVKIENAAQQIGAQQMRVDVLPVEEQRSPIELYANEVDVDPARDQKRDEGEDEIPVDSKLRESNQRRTR